ncbi:MAG: hypothetical protein PHD82_16025 [Candidatus Riflebacteria bacterium]|nr:hypothetical protein [Candidatus Riflebacteria bacterium]
MQDQIAKKDISACRLGLQFRIEVDELKALCARFQSAIADGKAKKLSTGMIAVMLTRIIKEAIDLKFENKPVSAEHLVLAHDSHEPEFNRFKASLVRGMFLTFIEYPQGFPGFFEIISGIAAAGLGYGSFFVPGTDKKMKLSEIKSYYPEQAWLDTVCIDLMERLLVPENLCRFASARIGLFSLLVGCALLPFYAASVNILEHKSDSNSTPDAEKVMAMVTERFNPESDRLKKFLNQNLFVVLFEELFSHETTVFSIFKL